MTRKKVSTLMNVHQGAEIMRRDVTLVMHIIGFLTKMHDVTNALSKAFNAIILLYIFFSLLAHISAVFKYAFDKLKSTQNRALNILWSIIGIGLCVALFITFVLAPAVFLILLIVESVHLFLKNIVDVFRNMVKLFQPKLLVQDRDNKLERMKLLGELNEKDARLKNKLEIQRAALDSYLKNKKLILEHDPRRVEITKEMENISQSMLKAQRKKVEKKAVTALLAAATVAGIILLVILSASPIGPIIIAAAAIIGIIYTFIRPPTALRRLSKKLFPKKEKTPPIQESVTPKLQPQPKHTTEKSMEITLEHEEYVRHPHIGYEKLHEKKIEIQQEEKTENISSEPKSNEPINHHHHPKPGRHHESDEE